MRRQNGRHDNSRDGGAPAQRVSAGVLHDGELVGVGLPDVLRAVVVLGRHDHLVRHQEGGVEAHAELANQLGGGLVLALRLGHLGEELAGARLGDGAQVPHQVLLGHAHARVGDVEQVVGFVRLEVNTAGTSVNFMQLPVDMTSVFSPVIGLSAFSEKWW